MPADSLRLGKLKYPYKNIIFWKNYSILLYSILLLLYLYYCQILNWRKEDDLSNNNDKLISKISNIPNYLPLSRTSLNITDLIIIKWDLIPEVKKKTSKYVRVKQHTFCNPEISLNYRNELRCMQWLTFILRFLSIPLENIWIACGSSSFQTKEMLSNLFSWAIFDYRSHRGTFSSTWLRAFHGGYHIHKRIKCITIEH